MKFALEYPCGADSPLELLPLKAVVTIGTAKILRGGSRLLPQLAVGVAVLLFGAYLWLSNYIGNTLSHDYTKVVEWGAGEQEKGRADGGLRVVVFGGGDVATLSEASWQVEGPNAGWTETLCQQASPRINPTTSFSGLELTHIRLAELRAVLIVYTTN
ncbi:hypothetical protein F4820DRAFT_226626 [Hypoxylon rubiginosum]|uniref:Uncharacterized protein n=1 Tax=Hypoxylon rubiginosum TaxID=110542 RepID=A0ACB9Z6I4_9PEZI|nr:hypothetical protein F4820DRAFT_226626 [Hypoxylon rubiginosum]